jgi:beta-glucanase (GH16 family)
LSTTLMATDAAGTYSCGARVVYVMGAHQLDQRNACGFVQNEFPALCTYNPTLCDKCPSSSNNDVTTCPKLTWNDEFDGTALDASHWSYQTGDGCDIGLCGWGNNELEYYQASNVQVHNGKLVIEARQESVGGKPYTSGRIRTKNLADFTYGHMQASIQIPRGQGLWPAFWLLPTDQVFGSWPQSGEIDIMENIGKEPYRSHGTLHYGPAWPNNKHQGSSLDRLQLPNTPPSALADGFHEYSIDWTPDQIIWSVDGGTYLTLTKNEIQPWPFNESFHILLNVAVGGTWPGNPDGTTTLPQQMQVDYVRVYDQSLGRLQGPMYVTAGDASRLVFALQEGISDYTYAWSVPAGATIVSAVSASSKRIEVQWGSAASGYVQVTATSKACGMTKTLQLPVQVVPAIASTSGGIVNCTCASCKADTLQRLAGDYSCIDRMNYVMTSLGKTESDACAQVSNEFPSICGPQCDPSKCNLPVSAPAVTINKCAVLVVKMCYCGRLSKKTSCWGPLINNTCAGNLTGADRVAYAVRVVNRAKRTCP